MGTDIHCFVEERMYRFDIYETDRTGKWISIDKWTKNSLAILYPERDEGPIWEVERKEMFFTERNYSLFAILANQRNAEDMPYISDPRGLPEDVSPEIPPQIRILEGHSTTWFTAQELLEYNWDQVFEYEDETMAGEIIFETVNYKECGQSFLEALNRLIGPKNPADIRLIITFDC
ncbi:hypothetical protein NST84_18395 [Paenibacillus sp. FSL R7-0345]|uniref:hypothetical protein n=1 Tax=Paenibacillus sp. FSL R7-0345 TaxID=2954535 RepID=UPI00315B3360